MKKLIGTLRFTALSLAVTFMTLPALAQINQPKEIQTAQAFGAYTVHYNVFNSKMVSAEIAQTYKLTRGPDLGLINISLTKTQQGATSLGLPAKVSAIWVNLMQQSKALSFIEIKEPEANGASATYYLAPFRYTNEEDLRFEISVLPEGESQPLQLSFSRRLFTEK